MEEIPTGNEPMVPENLINLEDPIEKIQMDAITKLEDLLEEGKITENAFDILEDLALVNLRFSELVLTSDSETFNVADLFRIIRKENEAFDNSCTEDSSDETDEEVNSEKYEPYEPSVVLQSALEKIADVLKRGLISECAYNHLYKLCHRQRKIMFLISKAADDNFQSNETLNQLLMPLEDSETLFDFEKDDSDQSDPTLAEPTHEIQLHPFDDFVRCGVSVKERWWTREHAIAIGNALTKLYEVSASQTISNAKYYKVLNVCMENEKVANAVKNGVVSDFKTFFTLNRLLAKHGLPSFQNLMTPKLNQANRDLANKKDSIRKEQKKLLFEEQAKEHEKYLNNIEKARDFLKTAAANYGGNRSEAEIIELTNISLLLENCIINFKEGRDCSNELQAKRTKKTKTVPPTKLSDYVLTPGKEYYLEKLKTRQRYEFTDDEEDTLLFCESAIDVPEINARTFIWSSSEITQSLLEVPSTSRTLYKRALDSSKATLKRLEEISLLCAYFEGSYSNAEGLYSEERILELICVSEFSDIKPLPDHVRDLKILKDRENKKRLKNKEDSINAMTRTFGYLDIKISNLRSCHKLAKYFCYLLGYLLDLGKKLDNHFNVTREFLLKMMAKYTNPQNLPTADEFLTF